MSIVGVCSSNHVKICPKCGSQSLCSLGPHYLLARFIHRSAVLLTKANPAGPRHAQPGAVKTGGRAAAKGNTAEAARVQRKRHESALRAQCRHTARAPDTRRCWNRKLWCWYICVVDLCWCLCIVMEVPRFTNKYEQLLASQAGMNLFNMSSRKACKLTTGGGGGVHQCSMRHCGHPGHLRTVFFSFKYFLPLDIFSFHFHESMDSFITGQ